MNPAGCCRAERQQNCSRPGLDPLIDAPFPCLTDIDIKGNKEIGEAMPSWVANSWDTFSTWVTNQPIFVEVAIGIGLFFVVLQLLKFFYKLIVFLFSPLLSTPARFRKQKDLRPKPRKQKKASPDDDSPPFVFR